MLENLSDKAPKTLKLIDFVCDSDHSHDHTEKEHEHSAYDEHVWLSLKNASSLVRVISDELSNELPALADGIDVSSNAYISKLEELDAALTVTCAEASIKTLMFADRFPFGYFVEDYSLEYHAAFSGCSADSEASFETVAELAKKLDELSLPYVLVLESSDKKLAETVIASTTKKNAEILVIDSMQSVTKKDIEGGASYLSIMESNAEIIKKALGVK